MNIWLVAAAFMLVHPKMNEAERYQAVAPFITPPPGKSATLSKFSTNKYINGEDQMSVYGSVVINPPKNSCFIVSRHPSLRDNRICEESKINFTAAMLDWDGSFSWKISTNDEDVGYQYKFPTPHRIAKIIKMGERPDHFYDKAIILKCNAYTEAGERRIVLDVLKGKKWIIRFPKDDIYKLPPHKYDPNDLYFDPNKVGKEEGLGELGTRRDPRKEALENAKKKEHVAKYWMTPESGAYTMPASQFSSTDSPVGSKGECLYQYKGAYKDPLSGWLECHYADAYDVLYVPITCAHQVWEAKQELKK